MRWTMLVVFGPPSDFVLARSSIFPAFGDAFEGSVKGNHSLESRAPSARGALIWRRPSARRGFGPALASPPLARGRAWPVARRCHTERPEEGPTSGSAIRPRQLVE